MKENRAIWWVVSILIFNAYSFYNVLFRGWDNTDIIFLFWLEGSALILLTLVWLLWQTFNKLSSLRELLKLLLVILLLWPVSTYIIFAMFNGSMVNWSWFYIITIGFIANELLILGGTRTNPEKFYIFKIQSFVRFGIVIGISAFTSVFTIAWELKEATAGLALLIFLRTSGDIWIWAVKKSNPTNKKIHKRSEFPPPPQVQRQS